LTIPSSDRNTITITDKIIIDDLNIELFSSFSNSLDIGFPLASMQAIFSLPFFFLSCFFPSILFPLLHLPLEMAPVGSLHAGPANKDSNLP